MRMTIQEAIRVLEINVPFQNLDENILKKHYKIMAKKYHPDINKDDNAEEMFKKVNQAKSTLESALKSHNQQNDMFSMFNDMFNWATAKKQIQPIIVNITLNLKEQYYGGNKDISFKRRTVCRSCEGKGCDLCSGQGFIIKEERINVNIQPGLSPESRLVFNGSGHEHLIKSTMGIGENVVASGDVILTITNETEFVKSDTVKFIRQGNDLLIEEEYNYVDFLKKKYSGELDEFEISLFDDEDTVKITKSDSRVKGFMIIKSNLGFKADYRSIRRGELVYIFRINWDLHDTDPEEIQKIIDSKNKVVE